jgi:non-specific protein-tyrosine kinase
MSKLKKALEKAKEARGDYERRPLERIAPAPAPDWDGQDASARKVYSPFKPTYTETKVLKCDPDFMQLNRILPVCTLDGADRLKILRTQILSVMKENGVNSLLVTSANPGEGKTLTAINLAISFSHQINGTVLLVDADIRKPMIHNYFGLGELPGLSDYLIGKAEIADILVNPGMDRLVILPGGRPLTNSAELIDSARMKALFKEMKQRYRDRYIIFDSAPVLTSADPLVFANFVDRILVVVEAEKTKRQDVKKVFDILKDKPVIGTVLNKTID